MTARLFQQDCLAYMRTLPDGYYDLALADPPYGIGRDWEKRDWRARAKYKACGYLNRRPPKEVAAGLVLDRLGFIKSPLAA